MTDLDHKAEVGCLLSAGLINSFMAHYLLTRKLQALDEVMWDEAIRDAETASQLGVDTDEEFKLFFYIDHFAEDLVQNLIKQPLSEAEQADLKKAMFGQRANLKFESLDDFYHAAAEWLKSNNKLPAKSAYRNVGVNYKTLPKYDLSRWGELVARINAGIRMGFRRTDAVIEAASELQLPERFDFLEWYNGHVSGENSKYDLNDEIKAKSRTPIGDGWGITHATEEQMEFTKVAVSADDRFYYLPRFREQERTTPNWVPNRSQSHQEPQQTALPPAVVPPSGTLTRNNEQGAVDFEAARNKIMGRVFAIDKLLEKYKKVLNPEQLDGVEDSLNDLKKKIRKLKMAVSIKDSLVKTAGIFEHNKFDEGAAELIALAAESDLPDESEANIFTEEAKNEKLKVIVSQLYDVSVVLKNRNIIRDIAEVDILLAGLRMASFFPEIQDAQAKLIDAFGYASNKIEDVLPKLRGGLVLKDNDIDSQITPTSKSGGDMIGELHELGKNVKAPASRPKKVEEGAAPEDEEDSDTLKQLLLPVRD